MISNYAPFKTVPIWLRTIRYYSYCHSSLVLSWLLQLEAALEKNGFRKSGLYVGVLKVDVLCKLTQVSAAWGLHGHDHGGWQARFSASLYATNSFMELRVDFPLRVCQTDSAIRPQVWTQLLSFSSFSFFNLYSRCDMCFWLFLCALRMSAVITHLQVKFHCCL